MDSSVDDKSFFESKIEWNAFMETASSIPSTDVIQLILTLKVKRAQVVETSVTNNSPIQYYVHPDDHTQPKYYYYCDTGKSKL